MSESDYLTLIDDPAPSVSRLRPALQVGGLLLLALLLTIGAWALFGSPEPDDGIAVLSEQDEAPEDPDDDVVEDPDADVADVVPVTTYEIYLARDPFDPVVPEDEPDATAPDPDDPDAPAPDPDDPDAPAPDPSDPDAPSPDPRDPDDPRAPGPDDPAPPPESGCEGDREEVVCDGRVVSLMEVTTDDDGAPLAVVQVDTTVYEVRQGERFAEHFRLTSFDGSCVNILHGDDGFALCEGERVMK